MFSPDSTDKRLTIRSPEVGRQCCSIRSWRKPQISAQKYQWFDQSWIELSRGEIQRRQTKRARFPWCLSTNHIKHRAQLLDLTETALRNMKPRFMKSETVSDKPNKECITVTSSLLFKENFKSLQYYQCFTKFLLFYSIIKCSKCKSNFRA